MFKFNLTLSALVAFSLGVFFSQAALAGSGVGADPGDGVGITRNDNGSLLNVTDPLRDGNLQFSLFGADGDTLLAADWNGNGTASFGVVREDNGALLWILDEAGDGTLTYTLFGSTGDRPVVGDFDTTSPGVEIGFVRGYPAAGQLEWIVQDGAGFRREFFGSDLDVPVPGNWDGDANNGDEFGLVRSDGDAKLWITEGTGAALDFNLFGGALDEAIAGDWDGDGNTDFAVRLAGGDGNVLALEGVEALEYVQIGAPSDSIVNSSSVGQ